ncbi:hypothetical protein MLD38_016106 [Melastoma candidum]|uniref:Uncharacterized protein n=1 Tax=Melastoma candidum TaxID=119954 RepID=A0ACB9RID9_9MYRT|nr:hypothetical protein MLD38_016106 [Melastoma candidum]
MRFQPYNLIVEYYRSLFLVLAGRRPNGSPDEAKATIRVDELHWSYSPVHYISGTSERLLFMSTREICFPSFRFTFSFHYRQGKWDDGGSCDTKTEPEPDALADEHTEFNKHIAGVIGSMNNTRKVQFLSIAYPSEFCTDAQPSEVPQARNASRSSVGLQPLVPSGSTGHMERDPLRSTTVR